VYTLLGDLHGGPFGATFGQTWTLNVEAKYYLLVPLVGVAGVLAVRALRGHVGPRARLAVILAGALGALVATCMAAPRWKATDAFTLKGQLLVFAAGIALAAVEPWVAPRVADRRWGRILGFGLLTAGIGVLFTWEPVSDALQGSSAAPAVMRVYTAAGATLVVAGPMIAQWAGRAHSFLTWGPVRWLGERSYSFYLFHLAILYELAPRLVVGGYKWTLLVLFPVALVATALAAEVSYRLVERPFLRRKARAHAPADAYPQPGELASQEARA
jgi:peptidoglycan/LPS O-acetylase OafA/YrhL